MDKIEEKLLEKIADLHKIPSGAFNLRKNGQGAIRNTTKEIDIIPKKNKSGIDIFHRILLRRIHGFPSFQARFF